MYSLTFDQIEKALSTDDIFDKLIDIKIELKERRRMFIKMLQDFDSGKVEKKILLNLISLENYFNEIIKNLIREKMQQVQMISIL